MRPHGHPGGPAPRQAAQWLVPGTVIARSARSSSETARFSARMRAVAARRIRSGSSWSAAPVVIPTPCTLRTPGTLPSTVSMRLPSSSPSSPPPIRHDAVTRPAAGPRARRRRR